MTHHISKSQATDSPSFLAFLSDHWVFWLSASVIYSILLLFCFALHISFEFIVVFTFLFAMFVSMNLAYEYLRRRRFYQSLFTNLRELDRAYLILETLTEPHFYDGRILAEVLYRVDKSMSENVQKYATESREFREYIEMWIHEAKTPLATLNLMVHDRKISAQLKQLDDYIEQVLYLVRAENVERDCLVKPVCLADVVHTALSRNQDLLLARNVTVQVKNLEYEVNTDQKWLDFIINQLITNSLKYRAKSLTFSAHRVDDVLMFEITDDGVGITAKDLPRIFDKSFTGSNGRLYNQKSTGMGLYIARALCEKLGHKISARSHPGQGTTIEIAFATNDYYKVTKK